jgi:iron complex outermembrane receptor protein
VLPVVNHLFAGGYGYRTVETPLNVDLNGEFDIGRVNHKILFGYAYDYSRTRDSGPEQNTTLMPLEAVGSLDWLHGSHYTFVPDPDFPYGSWNYYQRTQGIYFQELMSLGKHWKLLAGYRYDRARGGWEYISGGDDITGNFQSSGGTPRMGAVYQPSSATSFYASWSRSFNPNWGRLVDGSLPPPERGLQTEIGLKQDFYDGKVNLNVAAYQLTKRNVERCAPQDPDCRLYVLAGEQESRGLEFDLNGELSRSLRVTAALTLQSGARVKKDLPPDTANTWGGALPIGTTFPGGPHVIANLFAVYSFREARFRGLELGCGLNYASASEQNLPNDGYRLPGERTLNLFGAWSLSPRLRAQLNVNNVTNRIAYSSAGWQGWPWLYFANTPTQAIFTLSVKL